MPHSHFSTKILACLFHEQVGSDKNILTFSFMKITSRESMFLKDMLSITSSIRYIRPAFSLIQRKSDNFDKNKQLKQDFII